MPGDAAWAPASGNDVPNAGTWRGLIWQLAAAGAANGKQMEPRVIGGENLPPPPQSRAQHPARSGGSGCRSRVGSPPGMLQICCVSLLGLRGAPAASPGPFPIPPSLIYFLHPSLPIYFPHPSVGQSGPGASQRAGERSGLDLKAPAAPKHLPKPLAAECLNSIRGLI